MRRENLPDGGHDKVIWKCSRDRSRDKASQQRNSETWWRRTTATLLGVSFGTYMRRRRTNRTSWIRTTETSWWRTTETSLGVSFETCLRRRGDVLMGRHHYVPMRRHRDIPIRRREDVPLRRRWVFHLRRTCDIVGTQRERRRYDVATTSCCQMGCYVKAQNGRLRLTSLKVFSYIIKVWDELIASIKTSALTW